jgi:hypothetical protein
MCSFTALLVLLLKFGWAGTASTYGYVLCIIVYS